MPAIRGAARELTGLAAPGLPHVQPVTQNPVRRVEHCERSAARRVVVGEVRADDPIGCSVLVGNRKRHDHDSRVERPNCLDAQQLEPDVTGYGLAQGADAGLGRAAKFSGLGGQAVRCAGKLFRATPGEANPDAATAIGETVEHELGKSQALVAQYRWCTALGSRVSGRSDAVVGGRTALRSSGVDVAVNADGPCTPRLGKAYATRCF